MKKRIKKLPVVILLILIASGTGITFKLANNEKPQEKDIIKENAKPIKEEENIYVDDSQFKLGLYLSQNVFTKVTEHSNVYKMSTDIGVFTVFATNQEHITGAFQPTWLSLWKNNKNYEQYKIGYNIKFSYANGEKNINVLKPSDGENHNFYPFLFVYLYDDINIKPGEWNRHLEDHQVTEKTLFTSIKLTGNAEADTRFTSPIKLTVFTYKSDADFDPDTGEYRGNSAYTITINQIK